MLKLRYTRHAKQRIKWRKISQEEIQLTLADPDAMEKQNGKIKVSKSIGKRNLQIIYTKENGQVIIITAIDKSD